jgi:hypothetical protein
MNTDYALTEAILDTELRHINFFNGRLLTGTDLEEEQSAQHAHFRQLGEAIGEGVAFGLSVSSADTSPPDGPVVSVTKGLAVNRAGQTLRLECDQRVALTRSPDPAAADACIFADCDPGGGGASIAGGAGYYVLTIAPASLPDGKAPVSGLGNTTAICNSRYSAEGVKFNVFRLNLAMNGTPKARNLLAQTCFGISPGISAGAWPASLPVQFQYGWEKLTPPGFDANQNVALAVFEWTSGGLGFVKRWPVRRRVARRNPVTNWAYFTSDRRVAEGEAMFFDFQSDLAYFGAAAYAGTHFAQLPAGGILPAGANWKTFLGPMAPGAITPISPGLWDRLLRDTFSREPINVPLPDAKDPGGPTVLPALKVYKIPERGELLFARSPLGRLRIFKTADMEELTAILGIRDANGVLRASALLPESPPTGLPVIADDLPGGSAEIWVLVSRAQEFEFEMIENDAAKAKSKSKRTKKVENSESSETRGIVAGGIMPELRGGFRGGVLAALLAEMLANPNKTAAIVNGRMTDIEISPPQIEGNFDK